MAVYKGAELFGECAEDAEERQQMSAVADQGPQSAQTALYSEVNSSRIQLRNCGTLTTLSVAFVSVGRLGYFVFKLVRACPLIEDVMYSF
jgi:hypothetical protein